MDFRLTEQQIELQDAIRTYCERIYPLTDIGALDREPLRAGDWERLADLDVFRLAAPAGRGGLGLGVVETAVVYEVLGGHLVPGPLVWTALAAIHLPEFAEGAAVVGGHEAVDDASAPVLIDYGPYV